MTGVLGAAAEAGYRLPGRDVALIATTGVDQMRPTSLTRCADGWQPIRDPLFRWSITPGFGWGVW